MKLHQLEALVASADTGSIRAAARVLGISQPAVTRALRELEADQELSLLIRTPTGLTFTEHGAALLAHARLVLNQLKQAESQMSIRRGQVSGRLCVGVTSWLALSVLPEIIAEFKKRMPQVHLEFFESMMIIAQPLLREGYMDIAITQASLFTGTTEFEVEPLVQYETGIMVRQGHPLQHSRSIHELLDQIWTLNFTADGREAVMDEIFWQHNANIDDERILLAHSSTIAQTLVEHFDACAWVPKVLHFIEPYRGKTSLLDLQEIFRPRELSIISRRTGTQNTATRCFIDCVVSVIKRKSRSRQPEDRYLFSTLKVLS